MRFIDRIAEFTHTVISMNAFFWFALISTATMVLLGGPMI
jgi:hypothetical protein